jgi:hypothetical protein
VLCLSYVQLDEFVLIVSYRTMFRPATVCTESDKASTPCTTIHEDYNASLRIPKSETQYRPSIPDQTIRSLSLDDGPIYFLRLLQRLSYPFAMVPSSFS